MEIKVKYFDKEMPKLVKTENGDMIDLRVANIFICQNNTECIKFTIKNRKTEVWTNNDYLIYNEGEVLVMRFGVAIELPEDKRASVVSRSSTFTNYGLILTNGMGVIDNAYKGDNDEWLGVFYATRSGVIHKYDRICQFDIVDRMNVEITEVEKLGGVDRNGYGSTGKQ